ncbi:hypothetical protein FKM82_022338 [Ascaphus truei]
MWVTPPGMAGRAATGALRAALSCPRPGGALCWARGYAKKLVVKGKGKGILGEVLKGPDVCKDPVLLTTHAMGVNIFKTGPDVMLKEDVEYPEWCGDGGSPPKKLGSTSVSGALGWAPCR